MKIFATEPYLPLLRGGGGTTEHLLPEPDCIVPHPRTLGVITGTRQMRIAPPVFAVNFIIQTKIKKIIYQKIALVFTY